MNFYARFQCIYLQAIELLIFIFHSSGVNIQSQSQKRFSTPQRTSLRNLLAYLESSVAKHYPSLPHSHHLYLTLHRVNDLLESGI